MYFRILLAIDLSESSKLTARKAWELATHFDAKLFVVHVVEATANYGYPGVTNFETPNIDAAKAALAKLCETLFIPQESQYVLVGTPKVEILKKAKELGVDLIVVGSHGHEGMKHLLGTTASEILHGAECDIVTVRSEQKNSAC